MSGFSRLFGSKLRIPQLLAAASLTAGGGALVGYSIANYQAPVHHPSAVNSTLAVEKLSTPKYASLEQTHNAISRIKAIVGEENVSLNRDDINAHADSDFQFRHAKPRERSVAVVYPQSTEEISEVMKICHEFKVPLSPYSGGTSLEGQYTPVYQGITLDLSHMNRILQVNPKDMDVVVQPGVTWENINEEVEQYGLRFGPDPGPSAMIGGMVGTNASGTNAMAMGTMRGNVVGLKVVLADGTVVQTRRRPRKTSAGYSLTDLFVGSEGTLGVVVEATLKLHAKPDVIKIGALSFPTIQNAASLVEEVLQSNFKLDAMELMDDGQMKMINTSGLTDRKWDEKNTLLVRFAGQTKEAVDRDVAELSKMSKKHGAISLIFAKTIDEGEQLWAARKNALFSVLASAPPGYKTFGTDTAVPISQLSRFVEEAQQKITEKRLMGNVLGHVGDGNFHVCIAYNPTSEEFERVLEFAEWVANRSIELEGTCTGEHGIGVGKRKALLAEVGQPAVDLMRQVKRSLDPHFIMNPGKIFSIEPFDDHDEEAVQPQYTTVP